MKQAVRAIIINNDSLLVMKRNKFGSKYCTLIGGGVDMGEELETAIRREISEETGVTISNPKLVFIEEVEPPYGTQYIFHCEYVSGDVVLSPDAPEAHINRLGQNLYEPAWIKLSDLKSEEFRPPHLLSVILQAAKDGFPDKPVPVKG